MQLDKKQVSITLALALGIMVRFLMMTRGYNYDFESYWIVGDLASNFHNVYAETSRYNYGFNFFCIQGLLYKLAQFNSRNAILTYRVLIVSLLTLVDIGITMIVADRKLWKMALVFFLNPISIVVTGYYNQFDNIAIFLALIAIYYYSEDKSLSKKDVGFVIFMTASLITKHIFFLMPVFIIFRKNLCLKKKLLYGCVPPFLFLVSFIPFALSSEEAYWGIRNNVFLYRSYNNAPLLHWMYESIPFLQNYKLIVYGMCMCLIAFVVRKKTFEQSVMIYLVSMVAFASAIADQYIAIPMVALCMLDTGILKYVYMIIMGAYLVISGNGMMGLSYILHNASEQVIEYSYLFVDHAYAIAAWMLLAILVYVLSRKKGKKMI